MYWFWYVFPFYFIGLFIFVGYVRSRMGWRSLAEKYRTAEEFRGERVGLISASVNGGNYKMAIILKYNYEGIYLKTILLFRAFHPPVMVPWKDVREVRDKKILFTNLKELVVGEPFVALITLKASVYDKIEKPPRFNAIAVQKS